MADQKSPGSKPNLDRDQSSNNTDVKSDSSRIGEPVKDGNSAMSARSGRAHTSGVTGATGNPSTGPGLNGPENTTADKDRASSNSLAHDAWEHSDEKKQ